MNHVITVFDVHCAADVTGALEAEIKRLFSDLLDYRIPSGYSEWQPEGGCELRFVTPWVGVYSDDDRALHPDLEKEILHRLKAIDASVQVSSQETYVWDAEAAMKKLVEYARCVVMTRKTKGAMSN